MLLVEAAVTGIVEAETYKLLRTHVQSDVNKTHYQIKSLQDCAKACLAEHDLNCSSFSYDTNDQNCDLSSQQLIYDTGTIEPGKFLYALPHGNDYLLCDYEV